MTTTLPRGIRNNNPGNLRRSKIKWQGKVAELTDPEFEQFVSPEMGIRAIARDLLTGYKRGSDTVTEIISEYAPPTENNTKTYINAVCLALNAAPDTVIDVDRCRVMLPLVKAIIRIENGDPKKFGRAEWYPDDVILTGMRSAGVSDAPQAEPAATVEAKGAVGGATSGLGVTAIESVYDNLDRLEPIKQTLIDISPAVSIAKYVLLALSVVGAVMVMYGLVQKFRKGLA